MLRTFIAIKIPPTSGLRALHARLADLGERFHPVPLDSLHVTLKFLGDTPEDKVSEVTSVLERIVAGRTTVHLRLVGVGAFPNARRPSVFWVGLEQNETLSAIASELDRQLVSLGFPAEGRFYQPHLTLLRIRVRPPESLFAILKEEAQTELGMVEIDCVEYIESQLGPRGSQYTTLSVASLARR